MVNFETKREKSMRIMKALLRGLDLNVSELAEKTGVGYMALYYIYNGQTKNISNEIAQKICDAFPPISKDFLLTGEGELFIDDNIKEEEPAPATESQQILAQCAQLLEKILAREDYLQQRYAKLLEKEQELHEREIALLLTQNKQKEN